MSHQRCPNLVVVLAALLVLASPRFGWAQFTFTTNNGAITITGYTGSSAYMTIPSATNGYPVTAIGDYAFEDTALYGVTIPDSIVSIGIAAFYYCYTLMNVTIPSSVTNINTEAFCFCPALKNITVDAANQSYASAGGVLFNKTLTKLIQFPGAIGSLAGSYAIPNSVTSIEAHAFDSCYGLTNVTIGNGVISIGDGTFKSCSGLKSMTIPDSVVSIGDQAFYGSGLTNLTLGNSVTSIGDGAFSGSGLTRVAMGNSIISIGDSAFEYCSHLASVTIPASVINIGDSAFEFCSGLTNVAIGNGVINVGAYAFYSCSSLTSVTIPDSVASIGTNAFNGCSGLTNVTMGNSVTRIGNGAFGYCTSLHQAHFGGNSPSVNGGAGSADSTVFHGESGTAYYLPGTKGWGATFGGWPTARWYQPRPQILGSGYGLGAQSNRFQFTISWATNTSVVVEASSNLLNWTPVITNTLVNGTNAFWDSDWSSYPQRFYRVRSR
jgi:hypothetical protein